MVRPKKEVCCSKTMSASPSNKSPASIIGPKPGLISAPKHKESGAAGNILHPVSASVASKQRNRQNLQPSTTSAQVHSPARGDSGAAGNILHPVSASVAPKQRNRQNLQPSTTSAQLHSPARGDSGAAGNILHPVSASVAPKQRTRRNIQPSPISAPEHSSPAKGNSGAAGNILHPVSLCGSPKQRNRSNTDAAETYSGNGSTRNGEVEKQLQTVSSIPRNPKLISTTKCKPAKLSPSNQTQKLSNEDIHQIEKETRGQRENSAWHDWRKNRVTASMAHQISHSRFANQKSEEIPQSYLKAVLGTGPRVQTPAMSWGIRNEKNAVQAYENLVFEKEGRQVKVEDSGLFIHPSKNWLAASPDGIVKDGHTGETLGVVEVKCPYKHKEHSIREACTDPKFCLKLNGDSYTLRSDHPYYTQVQCQLAATQLSTADFVVHTNKETAVVPVHFNPEFWETTEAKLERFYTEAVLPQVKKGDTSSGAYKKVWAVEE